MPSNYVSSVFETLYQAPPVDAYRCIVRNRDDGPAPPAPSSTYFPTEPNLLREFLVFEHVNDVIGERLVGVAAPGDFDTLDVQRLTTFRDLTANFLTANVQPGDILQISMANPEVWVSAEYPDAGLRFAVAQVVNATTLRVATPFPSWRKGLSWQIPARGLAKVATGVTVRAGDPAPLERYRDRRYQGWLGSAPDLDAFVAATKTAIDLLAFEVTQVKALSGTESYTSTYPRVTVSPYVGG